MATNIEQILGRDINSLKELREEIKRLQDSIASVDPASKEFADTSRKLIAAQEQLTSVTRAGKDENVAAKDSIVGMEKEYKALYNTYKMLTEEQRNSDFGKNMADSLNTLSTKLNDTKKGVGNFKDNIGRYTESVMDAFKQMGISLGGLQAPLKLATNGVKGLNTALKANPLMAVIGAIQLAIAAITKMKDAIAGNEELQLRWNKAMSAFQPIADAMARAVDKVAEQFVKLVEGIASAVRWLREAKGAITDFFGITKDAKKRAKELNDTYKSIADAQANLIKNKREYQVLNSKDEAEVQRLREEASETSNLQEKRELLTQAKEIQAQIDERNIQLAKDELAVLEEQARLTPNSIEMNNKLAEATAKVADAEAQAAANARMFNKQLGLGKDTASSAAGSMSSSFRDLREEAKKLYEETVENAKSEIQKLTEKYQKEKALLEKYHLDTTLLTKQYNAQVEKLNKENAQKILDDLKGLNSWKAKAMNEYLISVLKDENEAAKAVLEVQEESARQYRNSFHMIWDTTEMFDDLADKFKAEFENAIADGFDGLEFPPEGFVLDSEENVEEILTYIDNFFGNLIDKIRRQRQEIEDELSENRIAEKINADLEKMINDELEILNKGVGGEEYLAIHEANVTASLEAEKAALEEELANFKGTKEKELEILQRYYEVVQEMRQRDWEEEQRKQDEEVALLSARFDAFDIAMGNTSALYNDAANGLLSMANGYKTLYNAQLEEGKLSEKEAEKKKRRLEKLEKVIRDVTIAQIAAQTAAGIVDTWVGYMKETSMINPEAAAAAGPGAPALLAILNATSLTKAIAKSVGLVTTAAGQIAAAKGNYISNTNSMPSEGGSAPLVANVQEIDSQPYTMTRQLQTTEEYDATYNKEYWVSVTDIDRVQNTVRVREEEASF